MKKSILALTVVGFLVGCGGGGGSTPSSGNTQDGSQQGSQEQAGQGANKGDSTSGNSTWNPVTSNFTCDPDLQTYNKYSVDTRYAADGGIKVECVTQLGYTIPAYSLVDVDSIEVTDCIKTERISGVSDAYGSFTSVDTSNFKTGKKHIKGTSSNFNIDCVETYTTILPKMVESDMVEEFIDFDLGDETSIVSTTCPKSYYDDVDNDNFKLSGTYINTIDIVITDSNGKTHNVSSELKGTIKGE